MPKQMLRAGKSDIMKANKKIKQGEAILKFKYLLKKAVAVLLCCAVSAIMFAGCTAARSADIAVLYTGDVHCAVDDNIGYAGLAAYKKSLAAQGSEVVLVDTGDAIQGGPIGSFSEGESIIQIMNSVGYDAMGIGNHEFDYNGPDRLAQLEKEAKFPFLSVNFTDKTTGKAVYEPYTLVKRDGVSIAFVGVSTPESITKSTPAYFMDEKGEFKYEFLADDTGEKLWKAVQSAVDSARKAGADYVIALSHLGISASSAPYCSNDLIANTTGINAVLDGHSHSVLECERVKNRDGRYVLLSSTGTKLENIGLLVIGADGNISTGLVSGYGEKDAETEQLINGMKSSYEEKLKQVVAHADSALVINDPAAGIRIVRNAETNLGDFCADAYRAAGGADIAFVNGGGIRAEIKAGDVTFGDVLAVNPFGNMLCKVSVTGQQVLDALEFGARSTPEESGGFLQVSGVTYEIDTSVASSVQTDKNGMFVSVDGEYRVKNVTVGGAALDTAATYTLVSHNYMLKNYGDGFTMFKGCTILMDEFMVDSDALTQYMGGEYKTAAANYADPYGAGRIILK